MSFTKITGPGISSYPVISGIITALNFKTGTTNIHSVGVEAAGINILGGDTPIGTGATIFKDGSVRFGHTGNNNTGIVTANKVVATTITATTFSGDGSNLTSLPAGLGTALSSTQTSPLNKLYYTDNVLSVGATITVDPPSSASAAYTQYTDIVVEDTADLIMGDGDDLVPDILGLSTETATVYSATGGRIRAGTFTNAGANGAPTATNGWIVTGVNTATTFKGAIDASTGNFSSNVTISGNLGVAGTVTYEDVARVDATGISTFREGFNLGPLAGIALTAYKDGSIRSTGIITATTFGGEANSIFTTGGTERLRINSVGDALLGGHGSRIFDDTSATNVVVDVYGGTTAGKRGILSLSGRTGSDNADLGTIWFANENNTQAGTASHNTSKLVASIDVKSETTDNNAGSDSGGHMIFSTKAEAGQIAERLRIASGGQVSINSTNTVGFLNVKAETDGNLHVRQIGAIASGPAGTGIGLDVLNDAGNAVKDLAFRGSTVIFRTASAESLRISSIGHVTKPTHCSFNYGGDGDLSLSSGSTLASWRNNGTQCYERGTKTDGGSYLSSGVFTAPVTGSYFFTSTILLKDITNSTDGVHVYWCKNNTGVHHYWNTRFAGETGQGTGMGYGGYVPVIGACTMYLSAGDTCRIKISYSGSGVDQYAPQNDGWTNWSGFLIG